MKYFYDLNTLTQSMAYLSNEIINEIFDLQKQLLELIHISTALETAILK